MTQNPRTSVMDADRDNYRTPRPSVQRHPVDFHNLADDVAERITNSIVTNPIGCHYFNPAVTISCPEPSAAFFQLVKKEQARWCRQASSTFENSVHRKVSSWISPAVVNGERDQYHDRALCFTGILFINGKMIPHHNWPVFVNSKSR